MGAVITAPPAFLPILKDGTEVAKNSDGLMSINLGCLEASSTSLHGDIHKTWMETRRNKKMVTLGRPGRRVSYMQIGMD